MVTQLMIWAMFARVSSFETLQISSCKQLVSSLCNTTRSYRGKREEKQVASLAQIVLDFLLKGCSAYL